MSNHWTAIIEAASFQPDLFAENSAWIGHLPFACYVMKAVQPEVTVELGSHWGHSYFAFCKAVKEYRLPARCFAVDTWAGDPQAGEYSDEVYQHVKAHNQKHYPNFSNLLRMTFDEALEHFSEASVGLLHIDGLHTYEAVKHDFESWLPKLAPGAVVLFHDTNVRDADFGVWKFWAELKQLYPNHFEFTHSHGLGVIQLDGGDPQRRIDWLIPHAAGQHQIKEYFASLGDRQHERLLALLTGQHVGNLESLSKQHLAERDRLVEELEKANAERCELHAKLESMQARLDQAVEDNEARVREVESLDAMRTDLLARIEELNAFISGLSNQASEAAAVLTEERDAALSERDHLVSQRNELNEVILAMKRSTSWRLTSPLRVTALLFKHGRRVTGSLIQTTGGIQPLLYKAYNLYRREGLSGLRRGANMVRANALPAPVMHPEGSVVQRNDYVEWIRRYDTLTDAARDNMRTEMRSFALSPIISIVVPTYDAPLNYLDQAIWSVRNQLYPFWELCIADDASKNQDVRDLLSRHAKEDERIKVKFRSENGHISAASNTALELATGDYVALMDNDDLLPEHALFFVAQAINEHPDAGLLYSDEDKITERDERFGPYFKSDYNPELFLAHNMISHLGVYRRDLMLAVGGFRKGFEGSQDYDLALRVIEQIKPEQIVHIPRVLYHWRAIPGSTALASGEKNYAAEAGRKAIAEHLTRRGLAAVVEPAPHIPPMNRVRFSVPDTPPLVSIIIPTRDRLELLELCIGSLQDKTAYTQFEIIIVDNGSVESRTLAFFDQIRSDRVRVVRDESPFNFSKLNNLGAREAKGSILCLMNNDIEILTPEWLDEMVSFACQKEIGCVGARLWYPDGRLQHGGVVLGVGGVANHAHYRQSKEAHGYFGRAMLHQSYSAVTAACLVVRREVYEAVNGLDEDFAVAFNDVDFCLRVRAQGLRNVWTPYAEMVHHESVSRGTEDNPEKLARFHGEVHRMQARWQNELVTDPAYNPNLTLLDPDFSLAWPPRVVPLNDYSATADRS